jgi:hypothetical protein
MATTVYVIMGEWAGRYMTMDDDVAQAALADGWAWENETPPEDYDPAAIIPPEDIPESLAEYESETSDELATDNGEEAESESSGAAPKAKRKYQKRRK